MLNIGHNRRLTPSGDGSKGNSHIGRNRNFIKNELAMNPNETVLISSTAELPTKCGGKGTIIKQWKRYPEFYTLLVWLTGETAVFHKSQLSAMTAKTS